MDLFLKDKVIIVTGGGKGIGEAIVRLLVDEGAFVVIIDKDEAAAKKLEALFPKKILSIATDLTSHQACNNALAYALKKYARIDGLVNNAGSNDSIGLAKGTPDQFIQSLTSNTGHYYFMAHFCLPYLKASKGSIVNIGSKTSITGQGNTSGYAAAKGAILALTREWAVELLPDGIRVNAVVPAEVWTPLYESWVNTFALPQEKLKSITASIPFEKRMTTADEIANTTVYLLSERAGHMTGQWIHVDGGYVHLDRSIK
jgi:L-fucose dehydrogenase